ncbi:LysM peptidoglycan-binding domain-containing protein [Glaciihabitans arcticus]|uniref:LysM peptidoglycan-binding domain-containing protein n=1 Tax=Glaciihabitans arcticus TaxID=2668039 RepID=A0A4Q9GNB2_9MICO|nr:LysM domain-containing protein [Glaciihabitans arcticus]TBN56145.1 LysM peptidoglycan-binding domain-containing protein [Glaciihabitans arcticus]
MIRSMTVLLVLLALAGCAAADEPAPVQPEVAASAAAKVADSGVADAATGAVDYENGSPLNYTSAAGDHVDAIAERFGMTVAELEQLNPTLDSRELVESGTVILLR